MEPRHQDPLLLRAEHDVDGGSEEKGAAVAALKRLGDQLLVRRHCACTVAQATHSLVLGGSVANQALLFSQERCEHGRRTVGSAPRARVDDITHKRHVRLWNGGPAGHNPIPRDEC